MRLSVGIVSLEYPPLCYGGCAVAFSNLANALADRGSEIRVVCGTSGKQTFIEENNNLKILRVPSVFPHFLSFQLRAAPLMGFLNECDVIIGPYESSSVSMLLTQKLGKKWVALVHAIPRLDMKALASTSLRTWTGKDMLHHTIGFPLREAVFRLGLSEADHLIVNTTSALQILKSQYDVNASTVTVIPTGVDIEEIEDVRRSSSGRMSRPEIIYVGRLISGKGIQYAISAVRHLVKKNPEIVLKICGNGPVRNKLRNYARKLGIEKNVQFLGQISHRNVLFQILTSDLLVFPSLQEAGTSNAVVEAMAVGKPIVAFGFPFNEESVVHGLTGLLTPPGNVPAFSNSIETLLSDKSLADRMSACARKEAREKNDMKIVCQKYLDLFKLVKEI